MFRVLLLKELREHLLSLRLQAGLLLALVLVAASAFGLSRQYRRENHEYGQRLQQADEFLSKYSHLNRVGGVLQQVKPPSDLVLVPGLPDPANFQTLDTNPMPALLHPTDLATVVAFIFSLLAIVLGFDAINGEKERGTLGLMLANHLHRFELLAAKWTGGVLVLLMALLTAWLAAALVVVVESGSDWGQDEAFSLAVMWGVSLIYCGVFYTLAVAFSALSRRSAVSVLTSIFAWILLVFVLPNVSPYVAAQIVRVPSLAVLQRDVEYITSEERDVLGRQGMAQMLERFGCVFLNPATVECPSAAGLGGKFRFEFGDLHQPSEATKNLIAQDPYFREFFGQLAKENEQVWAEVNRRQESKADLLHAAWRNKANRQFDLSKRLSYTSPLPPFVYASTELALTGIMSRRNFDRQVGAYNEILDQYLWNRFHEEQAKDPAFSVDDFLDVSTRPCFTYAPPKFSERFAEAAPFVGMLAGWNAAFFVAALLGFLCFDVR